MKSPMIRASGQFRLSTLRPALVFRIFDLHSNATIAWKYMLVQEVFGEKATVCLLSEHRTEHSGGVWTLGNHLNNFASR
jgi:hypothetical protein